MLDQPVVPEVSALANVLKSLHGEAVAVIAYGSVLRDQSPYETLIDYYLITETASDVSANFFSRQLCKLIPPNVYFAAAEFDGKSVRCKYAVVPAKTFARWVEPDVSNPYFWARFSQPCALIYARDQDARDFVIGALSEAARTAYGNALGIPGEDDPWTRLFRATYQTELRPENAARGGELANQNRPHFTALSAALAGTAPIAGNWSLRRKTGKIWALARLIKAAFTFQGGADYIAWKIERHSGEKIEVSEWQRRHPVLAGIALLPRLMRKGAVR